MTKKLEFGKDPKLNTSADKAGKLKDPNAHRAEGTLRPGKARVDLFGGNFEGGNSLPGRGRGEK